ncbi:MAG TPA: hypothetical protein PLT87_00010 [Spirochaetales bacterium]|nr:hypothetical protein [Spirochaetales bacterium]
MPTVNLVRADGTPIDHESKFQGSKSLGLVFSGVGYNYRNPLLYYSKELLLQHGCDYIGVDFKYYADPSFRTLSDVERYKRLSGDNDIVLEEVHRLAPEYDRIFLAGKSMGTSTVRHCLKDKEILKKAAIILFTPGGEWNEFILELLELDNPTLVVGSLADKLYTVPNLTRLHEKKNLTLHELQNANHSLEVNNVQEDLAALKEIMRLQEQFIIESLS